MSQGVNHVFEDYVRVESERVRTEGDYVNAHEVYGHLIDNIDTFWDQVKQSQAERNYGDMLIGLVQTAACCQKGAESLNLVPASRLTKGDNDARISELEDLLNEVLEFIEERGEYLEPAQKGGRRPYSVEFEKGQIRNYRERLEQ
jgi:hypothetical protein